MISALKHRRFNDQHQFPSIPEAQQPLCRDPRIRTFESAVAHNEPQCVAKAQALKQERMLASEMIGFYC